MLEYGKPFHSVFKILRSEIFFKKNWHFLSTTARLPEEGGGEGDGGRSGSERVAPWPQHGAGD